MSFTSKLFPGEPIINDSTSESALQPQQGHGRGLMLPMRHPDDYAGLAEGFPTDLLVPESEWEARIKEMEERKSRLSDIVDQVGLPCKDQGNTNYCVPAGTLVRMGDGSEKRIEDVKVLDEVVTAEGNVKRVLQTMARHVNEPIFTPVMWGHSHLRTTGGHPVLTKRGYVRLDKLVPGDKVAFPKYAARSATMVAPADHLEQRAYLRREKKSTHVSKHGLPGRKTTTITRHPVPDLIYLTEPAGRVIGLFLAEGHTSKWATYWSFNRTETDTFAAEVVRNLKSEFGAAALVANRGHSVAQVALHGKDWAPVFEAWCGAGAGGKRLHSTLMSGPLDFLRGVLTGWMDGDRHKGTSAVSISRPLALGMFDIANALGYMPRLSTHQYEKVDSRGMRHQHSWQVAWGDKGKPNHGTEQDDKHLWRKVYDVENEPFDGYVFNLEVEDDHSYVAEGIGVHNCWINAPVHCIEISRAIQNQEMVLLSPASAGGPIKDFRNEGGWGKEGLEYLVEHGCCPVDKWPANAISRSYWTEENKALALKYRAVEWTECKPRNVKEMVSALLRRWPGASGLNWWSHEVTYYDALWLDGTIAMRARNSWGMSYGANGYFTLQGSKMLPDDYVCLRTTTPS